MGEKSTRRETGLSDGERERLERVASHPRSLRKHARHWTVRALAKKTGMAVATMHGIPRDNGLRPHQVKTFKVSRDPRFEIKVRDVAGLYVNPPDHAVVLSVDEKPQIQALGGTQRSLPMTSDHAETRTRDYRRHGTTRLLAALDVATGKVVGRTVEVHEWLKDHPDWTFHFTPTSASRMNAVEGFFSRLARQRLKNAVFDSLDACALRRSRAALSTTTPGTLARSVGAAARRIWWSPGSGVTRSSKKWN